MPDVKIPLDGDAVGAWRSRIEQAETIRKQHEASWEQNIQAYEGKPLAGESPEDYVNTNSDYSSLRLKCAQLFYRTGDVQLSALRPDVQSAVPVFQSVLNAKLGPLELNARAMAQKVLFHAMTCGVGPSKIGYEAFTREVSMPVVDPALLPPGTDPATIPTAPVPQVVSERYFWEPFSPKRLLLPRDFDGDDYDKAEWIGMVSYLDPETAKRKYGLPEDFTGKSPDTDAYLSDEKKVGGASSKVREVEVWYQAQLFDPAVSNPEQIRLLVLLDGVDDPVVRHEDSPHQTVGPDGRLTPDSMRGYPVHPLTLNYVTDRAYPPGDASMIRPLVNEECKFRSQMIRQRDTSIPMRWADTHRIDPSIKKALEEGEWQTIVFTDGPGHDVIGEVARANYPRENFTAQDYIKRDKDEVLALGSNQRGGTNETERTATELQIIQGNVDVRLDYERGIVADWYVRGVAKLAALIQRYADDPDYVEVLGPTGTPQLQQWDKRTVAGRFAYAIKPDSTQRVDAAGEMKRALDRYNLLARDPLINRQELVADLLRAFGRDPGKFIAPPRDAKPEPPKVSYRFSGDDFNPLNPQFDIVLQIAAMGGMKVDPTTAKARAGAMVMASAGVPGGPMPASRPAKPNVETEHGGMAEKAEVLNRHQDDVTGGMPGVRK